MVAIPYTKYTHYEHWPMQGVSSGDLIMAERPKHVLDN
jgi:hypothetical protein